MTAEVTIFLTVALLILGGVCLVLALVARSYSVHRAGHRAGVLGVLGALALLAMVLLLQGLSWDTIWNDILWPMLVIVGGALAGLAMGLGLIYLVVAQR